jgi:hypothetical protein
MGRGAAFTSFNGAALTGERGRGEWGYGEFRQAFALSRAPTYRNLHFVSSIGFERIWPKPPPLKVDLVADIHEVSFD